MSATRNFKGGPELEALLSTLPQRLQKNVLRSGMRAGAAVVRKAAGDKLRGNSEVTGKLRRGLRVSTDVKGTQVVATLRATGEHGHVAHWIEYGVQPHSLYPRSDASKDKLQSVGDQHPGFDAEPFMRPALDENVGAVINAVGQQIGKRLTKEGLNSPDLRADVE